MERRIIRLEERQEGMTAHVGRLDATLVNMSRDWAGITSKVATMWELLPRLEKTQGTQNQDIYGLAKALIVFFFMLVANYLIHGMK